MGFATLRIRIKRGQTVEEVVGIENRVSDFISDIVQVQVARSVDGIGADDVDAAFPEFDAADRLVLVAQHAEVLRAEAEGAIVIGEERVVELIPHRVAFEREDALLEIERIAGDGCNGVVAAIEPEELDRDILAFKVAIVGDKELQSEQFLRQRQSRSEAGRMVRAIVGIGDGNDAHESGRTRAGAVTLGAIAIGEVFPAAGGQHRTRLGVDEV